MSVLKLEALRLANLPDLSPERVVERAAAFESYLAGTGAPADISAFSADEAAGSVKEGAPLRQDKSDGLLSVIERTQQSLDDRRREAKEALLQYGADDTHPMRLVDFLVAGMPEWMAHAAVEAMRRHLAEAKGLNKAERENDWKSFARHYFNNKNAIRAPNPDSPFA